MFMESKIAGVHGGYLLFTTEHFWALTMFQFDFPKLKDGRKCYREINRSFKWQLTALFR